MAVPKWMLMVITVFVDLESSMCQMLIVFSPWRNFIWIGEINIFGVLE